MSFRFDNHPNFSESELKTVAKALEWWLAKYEVPRPKIYWDETLDKQGLGGHFNPLTCKIFLDTHASLNETIHYLFHELWHYKRWLEGGANAWLEKGANLWAEHVPREGEEKLCDTLALAECVEFSTKTNRL